jgi:hypothetical protein
MSMDGAHRAPGVDEEEPMAKSERDYPEECCGGGGCC